MACGEIDLPARYRAMTLEILERHVPQAEVWAFGSRVAGGCGPASDLDLVVRNPTGLDVETPGMAALRGAFSESYLPIRVDVFDWARLPEEFRTGIASCYAVLRASG